MSTARLHVGEDARPDPVWGAHARFAATHKLDQKGAQAVFYHLKQKAAQQGLIKRVLYYQPFIAEVGEPKEKKMYNLTVYEDSDPAQLAIGDLTPSPRPSLQRGAPLSVCVEGGVTPLAGRAH